MLGHTGCGAIKATLDELEHPNSTPSSNLLSIVDRVRPAVEPLLTGGETTDRTTLAAQAGRANVRASVDQLKRGSRMLEQLIENDDLLIVGAEYSLETGIVDFFDEVPVHT